MVDECYYNEFTIETYQSDIDSILSADDSNSAVSGSNWISSSVGTCSNADSGTDANGNNCASYDSGTCTDCLCDASDDAGSFTYTDCCACGGGSKPTVCALTESLEILDVDTNVWTEYDQTGGATDNTSTYPWITSVSWGSASYADSLGSISVQIQDENSLDSGETETVKYLRWVVTDARSG